MPIIKWNGWPHVLKTQQFDTQTIQTMIAYMLEVEQAMVACQRTGGQTLPRKSLPCRRKLKIYRDEPSTRTEDTFVEAADWLGYSVRIMTGDLSSEVKGESLEELVMSITQVGGMGYMRSADILVIRHKQLGAAEKAVAAISDADADGLKRRPLPVINAGDGAGQHPTQAFVDLATIYKERGSRFPDAYPLENMSILMAGDTLYSRTINSLCHLLGKFGHLYRLRIVFCSHPAVIPKPGLLDYLKEHDVEYEVADDFNQAVREADVVYMTRIQEERYEKTDLFKTVIEALPRYSFTAEHELLLQEHAFVMHPLPIAANRSRRVPEIDVNLHRLAFQNHPKFAWARQSHRGVPVRYALLDLIEAGLQAED
jgi:aspartate carbamoyltransferase catalytic subunit